MNILFVKNHILWPPEHPKKSKFSRHMRNMGNAAEYFMFFKWKLRFVVCLCIFYKNVWVKSKGTILFTYLFYLGWKENSLKIDWDSVGRGAFRENCYDFNEMAAIPKLLSLLNRSLESRRLSAERKYFFLYYRWNVQDKNKLFVVALL